MSEIDWDVKKYEAPKGFEPVPAGDYAVKVKSHEWKDIGGDKAKGQRVNLTLEIVEGPHKGRTIFESLNVKATAPRGDGKKLSSAEFARGQFRLLVDCCGLAACKNVAELYGIPFVAVVSLKAKHDKPTEMQNEIRTYKKYVRGGDALPTGGVSSGSAPTPGGSAPWAMNQAV